MRSSPGLFDSHVRSTSLPPTPSELRSTLGREENPFSAAFSVNALPSSHLDLDKPGDNKQEGEEWATGDATAGKGSKQEGKKRVLSVSALKEPLDKGAVMAENEGEAPPPKRPSFAVGAFGDEAGQRPGAVHRTSFNSMSDQNSGSDGLKLTPGTSNTSVEASPKPSLFDQLNNSMPLDRSAQNYYQPAPRPFVLPHSEDTSLTLHAPSLVSPPLPQPPPYVAHQPFSLDSYSLQRTSPAPLPSPPLIKLPTAAHDGRSALQPHAPAESATDSAARRPPPLAHAPPIPNHVLEPPPAPPLAAVTVVPGPKKRGRKPRDPNAPVDHEQVAKARLSALERNR